MLLEGVRGGVRFRLGPLERTFTLVKTRRRRNGSSHYVEMDKVELEEIVYVKDQSASEYGMF